MISINSFDSMRYLVKFRYTQWILFLFWMFLLSIFPVSCKKFSTVDPPQTELIKKTVFENDLTATSAILGIYSGGFLYSGFTGPNITGGFSSDELIYGSDVNSSEIEFYQNNILPTNPRISSIWGSWYSIIYKANSIIEGLNSSSNITPALKKQLEGEAKFVRAFCHFYLVNFFGDIPLVTSTDYLINTVIPKSDKSIVYQKIISDLQEAQNLLPENYVNATNGSTNERVRANKWAATALLSRAYLYMEDWAKAEEQASAIISNTTMYSLTSLDDVFLKNNPEAIWQLMPGPGQNSFEGQFFILISFPLYASLTNEIVNAFEAGDNRRVKWVGSYTDGSDTWYFPYKYKQRLPTPSSQEYSVIIRLAEQYLIRAEARARQNKLTGANSAESDINIIRVRAGLDISSATTQAEFLSAIEQERKVELFTEWGHRWLDLKRWNRADAVLSTIKPGWTATDVLYPIPESEILINKFITQNVGY